jgi:hypothetical protein
MEGYKLAVSSGLFLLYASLKIARSLGGIFDGGYPLFVANSAIENFWF